MANKYFQSGSQPSKQSGGGGGSNKPAGKRPTLTLPNKTANWPGVPGGTQSRSRSAGVPETGHKGSFYVRKVGL